MKQSIILLSVIAFALNLSAQTTREEMAADLNKTGGVYYAYPTVEADNTPAPKGYKPFHMVVTVRGILSATMTINGWQTFCIKPRMPMPSHRSECDS